MSGIPDNDFYIALILDFTIFTADIAAARFAAVVVLPLPPF